MARSRTFHLLLLALLVTALFTGLFLWELTRGGTTLARWELRAGDVLARYGRKTPANDKIIFLAIDTQSMSIEPEQDLELFGIKDPQSLEGRALQMMSEKFPWTRAVYPQIMDRLFGAGAAVVVFDLTFPLSSENDEIFRASLDKYRDRIVIGSDFIGWEKEGVDNTSSIYKRPAVTLIPLSEKPDGRVGFTNFWNDVDEVVRDATFHASSLTLDQRRIPGDVLATSLAAQAVGKLGHGKMVPTDTLPYTLRLTAEPGRGFAPRSIFEIFVPEYWERNYRGGEAFRGAIVVVGAAGNWQHDIHPTALGIMPGPELQCNAINALLHDGFVQRTSSLGWIILMAGGGLGALALSLTIVSPVARVVFLTGAMAGYAGMALYMYNAANLVLPLVAPMATLGVNGFGGLLYDFAAVRRERRRLRSTFERYVSKNVVGELMEDSGSYLHALGGEVRPVTILFSDIRNFTRVCANTQPTVLVELLNEYLTVMVDCAFRFDGTLDKFIGDAIMVVWGNVRSAGAAEDARRALRCALAMQEELEALNARWERQGRSPFHIGIALNHGEVVAGSIGSPHRMEVTVIGDAVNVCWRLQERTKLHPGGLILGESMVELIGDKYPLVGLGSIIVGETLESEYFCLASQVGSAVEQAHATAT